MKANGDGLLTHNEPTADPLTVATQLIDGTVEAAKTATATAAAAPEMAARAARQTTRRWVWWVIAVAVVVPPAMTWAALHELGVRQAATDALVAEQAKQLDAFRSIWAAGNGSLLAQGKPVVPPPDNPGDVTDALVAAVVAQVRADLPAGLSRDDVQQIVERILLTRPPGPQGIGVSAIRPATRGGQCVLVATLRNPGNGATSDSVSGPISPALCDPNAGRVTVTTTAPAPTPSTTPQPRSTTTTTEAPKPSETAGDKPGIPDIPN